MKMLDCKVLVWCMMYGITYINFIDHGENVVFLSKSLFVNHLVFVHSSPRFQIMLRIFRMGSALSV